MNRPAPSHEWSSISLPLTLTVANGDSALGITCQTATLQRGLDMTLTLVADGTELKRDGEPRPTGRQPPPLRMLGRSADGMVVTLDGIAPFNRTWRDNGRSGSVEAYVQDAVVRLDASADGEFLVEWLYNAPQSVIWPRSTERRSLTEPPEPRFADLFTGFAYDHLELQLSLPSIAAIKFGRIDPKYSRGAECVDRPGFLEFVAGPRGLPDQLTRYTIRSALCFLFGCGLGVVGHSVFDSQRRLISDHLVGLPIAAGGAVQSFPALLCDDATRGLVEEKFCSAFVWAYVERQPLLHLDRAVWLLRSSLAAPVDMAAAYAGAAYEVMCRAHYELDANKQKRERLPAAIWKALRKPLLATVDSVSAFLPDHAEAFKKVREAVANANVRSIAETNKLLLNDLGLAHGPVELAALLRRNDAAHANPFDDSHCEVWLAETDALCTLAARTLFALVGVKPASYVDYGSSGPDEVPVRDWSQPQESREPVPPRKRR